MIVLLSAYCTYSAYLIRILSPNLANFVRSLSIYIKALFFSKQNSAKFILNLRLIVAKFCFLRNTALGGSRIIFGVNSRAFWGAIIWGNFFGLNLLGGHFGFFLWTWTLRIVFKAVFTQIAFGSK